MLQNHEKDHEYFPDGITQLPVPTLLSIDIFSLSSSSMVNRHSFAFDFEHFQIERFYHPSVWTIRLLHELVVSGNRLKSLRLPYHLHPTAALARNIAEVRDNVLSTCEERGIKVI
ncbi:hypothetical protein JCM8547_001680 [Rhodosporidiobolus lusitaniae]